MSSEIKPVTVPKWGLAMTEGTVTAWHRAAGETVAQGDEIVDVESSKIANVIEAPASGKLVRIVADEGSTHPVGALLAVIADDGVDEGDIDAFIKDFEENFDADAALEASTGPEPEVIEQAGYRIRILKKGEGDATPLILIHGFGGDLNNWMFNQDELAARRPVYAIDLPGHGGSQKDVGQGKVETLENAVAAVMAHEHIARAHLVGHSMGGAVALKLAIDSPDHVASVTTICGAGYGNPVNMDYVNGFIDARRRKDLKPVIEMLFHDPELVTRDMLDELVSFKRLDGVPEALEKLRDNMLAKLDFTPRLGELSVPLLAINGQHDRIITPPEKTMVPGKSVLLDCGHMAHMEKAGEVSELIAKHIGD